MTSLNDVQVGDKVVIRSGSSWSNNNCTIAVVERVTDTRFIADGVPYSKNGNRIGDKSRSRFYRAYAQLATPKLIEEVTNHTRLRDTINRFHRIHEDLMQAHTQLKNSTADRDRITTNLRFACVHMEKALSCLGTAEPPPPEDETAPPTPVQP